MLSFIVQLLMGMADDFIESVVTASCQLAKHRKSNTLETKDLQLHLGTYTLKIQPSFVSQVAVLQCHMYVQSLTERSWNMTIPGFSAEEQHAAPVKKSSATEAHKQVNFTCHIQVPPSAYNVIIMLLYPPTAC